MRQWWELTCSAPQVDYKAAKFLVPGTVWIPRKVVKVQGCGPCVVPSGRTQASSCAPYLPGSLLYTSADCCRPKNVMKQMRLYKDGALYVHCKMTTELYGTLRRAGLDIVTVCTFLFSFFFPSFQCTSMSTTDGAKLPPAPPRTELDNVQVANICSLAIFGAEYCQTPGALCWHSQASRSR